MSPAPKAALDMSVNVAGIELKNPVLAASGSFGYGVEFEDVVTLDRLGGFVTKGLSREPMAGNPPPRLFETAAGMLNAIGLQNIGARAFLEEKLPSSAESRTLFSSAMSSATPRRNTKTWCECSTTAKALPPTS